MCKYYLVVLFYLGIIINYGQSQIFCFKHITVDSGLAANNVLCIYQDSNGYMWFGTESGLNRYDGYHIKQYKTNSPYSKLLPNNNIHVILEDTVPGNLWIGTSRGLCYYNCMKDKFEIISIPAEINPPINHEIIKALYWGPNKKLWIGTYGHLVCFTSKDKIKTFKNPHIIKNNLNNYIECILYWKNSKYWICTNDGLYLFDSLHEKFEKINPGLYKQVFKDSKNSFWFGTITHGLYKFDGETFTSYSVENGMLNANYINAIAEDITGKLWISLRDYGIVIMNLEGEVTNQIKKDIYNPNGINSNVIVSIFQDRDNNLWLGTYDSGINLLDKNKKAFTHYSFNFKPDGLRNNFIRAMFQDSDEEIWIGTKINGCLSKFNKSTGTFVHYLPAPKKDKSLSDRNILCITEGRPGELWIGTLKGGLNYFNKKNGIFKQYLYFPDTIDISQQYAIYSVCKDYKNNLWVGTGWKGIIVYDENMQIIQYYTSNKNNPNSLSSDEVRYLYEDKSKNMWIGTNEGMNVFREKTNDFERFVTDETKKNCISSNLILSIFEDSKNRFWISTRSGGLNLMDRENGIFYQYFEKDGLASNTIFGIVEDQDGDLWISTRNGLSRFLISNQDTFPPLAFFRNYDLKDGLQSREFGVNAFLKTTEGELLFGGINGFNIFNPKDIKDNPIKPKINFTDFKLFNKSISIDEKGSPLTKHINNAKHIVLSPKQSIFTIEFVAINYSSPQKNQYAFKMSGLFDEWNHIGEKRDVTFTKLEAGEYLFSVKACNNDGIWNDIPRSITITILPFWWETWFFKIFALLFIATLLTTLYFWRIKRLTRQKQMLEEKVKERTMEIQDMAQKIHEADQKQLLFFTNISHEFRTPLTLIIEPLKTLMNKHLPKEDNTLNSYFRIMLRNANHLMRLINQLLDLRKLDLKEDPLQLTNNNIIIFVQELTTAFSILAEKKNIHLSFNKNHSTFNIDHLTFNKKHLPLNPQHQHQHQHQPQPQHDKQFKTENTSNKDDQMSNNKCNMINEQYNMINDKWSMTNDKCKMIDDFWFDPIIIEKILCNLIANAIKYTPDGGKILISIGIIETQLAIKITDTGIGIEKDELPKIFNRFYRIDNEKTNTQGGTGIGLSYTKDLVEKHEGTIKVQSNIGQGTTFTLQFPFLKHKSSVIKNKFTLNLTSEIVENRLSTYQEDNHFNEETELQNNTAPKILIIDDNPDIRFYLKNELKNEFSIIEAEDGMTGFDKSDKFNPDVIICDIMMPKLNGTELCKKIKSNNNTSHIPFILLTAKTGDKNTITGLETGADDYITKPFNISILRIKIRNHLLLRKRMREKFSKNISLSPNEFATTSVDKLFLDKAFQIVKKNFTDEKFSNQQFILEMGYGRTFVYRKIKALTNQSVSEFISCIRLKEAATLLQTTLKSVSEIAYMVGYKNRESFSRQFTSMFGMTPSQFKKQTLDISEKE